MKKSQSSALHSKIFKRLTDVMPVNVSLWKSGKNRVRWQENIMLYANKKSIQMTPAYADNIGYPAKRVLAGFEKTGFTDVFALAISTGQSQEFFFSFGNEAVPISDWHAYFVPLPQSSYGAFAIDITPQIRAEKAKAEKIKHLEEMNQKLVERELAMIQLKSEIMELEQKMDKKS